MMTMMTMKRQQKTLTRVGVAAAHGFLDEAVEQGGHGGSGERVVDVDGRAPRRRGRVS